MSMLDFFASEQDKPISNDRRMNYGCNCYGAVGPLFPVLDDVIHGKPVDDYDETCYQLKRCYQRKDFRHNFPLYILDYE